MKTKTAGPVLTARSPAWLIAKTDVAIAARVARDRHDRVRARITMVEDHAAEVAEKSRTSGSRLATNGQALQWGSGSGSGSGFEIIHHRCPCDGSAPCDHNPEEPPYTPAEIVDAELAAAEADEAHGRAVALLADTPQTFDAFANARENAATHVWWPAERNVDPRLKRYQGKPISPVEMDSLGVHDLLRAVQLGAALEVPA